MKLYVYNKPPKLWLLFIKILGGMAILAAVNIGLRMTGYYDVWTAGAAGWAFIILSAAIVVDHLQQSPWDVIESKMTTTQCENSIRFFELCGLPPKDAARIINEHLAAQRADANLAQFRDAQKAAVNDAAAREATRPAAGIPAPAMQPVTAAANLGDPNVETRTIIA